MTAKRALVICPGRGSYNKTELGYFKRYASLSGNSSYDGDVIATADLVRRAAGLPPISEMDSAAQFNPGAYLDGKNAAMLIAACALADYSAINRENFLPCCMVGNSMGWYLALIAGGALSLEEGLQVVQAMGAMPKTGSQLIYPLIDEEWKRDAAREALVKDALKKVSAQGDGHAVGLSIRLGGYTVIAGADTAIKEVMAALPKYTLGSNEYPFILAGHSAFHTELMRFASEEAFKRFGELGMTDPSVPLVDGRGYVWRPKITDPDALFSYTFGDQVVRMYDFTLSMRMALLEYAPDALILLGPGETLGGAIAQTLIEMQWQGIDSRNAFMERQQKDPVLFNMGRAEHFARVV